MARELACKNCGKIWRIDAYPLVEVRVESCQDCGKFKFHLEPLPKKFAKVKQTKAVN